MRARDGRASSGEAPLGASTAAPGRRDGRDGSEPDRDLECYLARLDAALAGLPAPEREEILLETRSHVVELVRRPPGRDVADALAELGAPEAYARPFLPEDAPAAVPPAAPPRAAPARGSATLRGLAQLTTRGWRAYPPLLLFAAMYAVAGVALLFVFNELTDPTQTGVFVEPRPSGRTNVRVVISSEPVPGRDVLGRALIPIGLLIALALHRAVRGLLGLVLRHTPERR